MFLFRHIRKFVVLIECCLLTAAIKGQPYVDVVNTRFTASPDTRLIFPVSRPTALNYFNFSTTLPLFLKNKKDAIILSPYYEQWFSQIRGNDSLQSRHQGMILPVSLLYNIPSSRWGLLLTPIVRINSYDMGQLKKWQFGGALIASFKTTSRVLTYKFGIYLNGEFFGLFFMPLLGIDWQINTKTNLFGVLPGSLTLEKKLSDSWYWGACFRAITNSYADPAQRYFRIDENQLGVFADFYCNKHIVANLEAGHSVLRLLRTGVKNAGRTDLEAGDNAYIKFSLAYRLRLR